MQGQKILKREPAVEGWAPALRKGTGMAPQTPKWHPRGPFSCIFTYMGEQVGLLGCKICIIESLVKSV